jgi:hypothetical protein
MKRLSFAPAGLMATVLLLAFLPARAATQHVWHLTSPTHGQTFTLGSEQRRSWCTRGADRHLAVLLDYTNDPYVDRDNPRQYDYFTFHFPQVTLGPDGRTFFFRASDAHTIPVARKSAGFLGIEETRLLPNSFLTIQKPHGYLTLTLTVKDQAFPSNGD